MKLSSAAKARIIFAVAMATFSGAGANAQRLLADPLAQLPRARVSGPLRGKAFVGRFEVIQFKSSDQARKRVMSGGIYRSNSGDMRIEYHLSTPEHSGTFVMIENWRQHFYAVLEPSAETGILTELVPNTSAEDRPMWGFQRQPSYTDEYSVQEGRRIRRIKLTEPTANGAVDYGSIWIDEDLQQVVKDECTQDGMTTIWQLTSYKLEEPNRGDLFEIPAHFKRVWAGDGGTPPRDRGGLR